MTNEELLNKYIQECFYSGNQIDDEERKAVMESYGFTIFKANYHLDVMAKALKEDIDFATLKAKEAFDKFSQSINNK